MDQAVTDFFSGKRLALVGVSRSGKKFGNLAYNELKQRGYQVYIVHPTASMIEGETCYPCLESLRDQVDGVVVSVSPEQGMQVLR